MPDDACAHGAAIKPVTPSAKGCEDCLAIGSPWVHLRLCRTCGHVGCCDESPNRHATAHFHATKHPVIEGYDPPEGWGWCYIDEIFLDLTDDMTPQRGRSRGIIEWRDAPLSSRKQGGRRPSAFMLGTNGEDRPKGGIERVRFRDRNEQSKLSYGHVGLGGYGRLVVQDHSCRRDRSQRFGVCAYFRPGSQFVRRGSLHARRFIGGNPRQGRP